METIREIPEKVVISAWVSKQMRDQIDAAARNDYISRSDVIRQMLRWALSQTRYHQAEG